MKRRFVLDAWAILALLQGEEPAASRVRELLSEADKGEIVLLISMINLGEVVYSVGRAKGESEAQDTLDEMRRLPLAVVPATEEAVLAAAHLKMQHATSYADALAASTAETEGATLVTGDPELAQLEGAIELERLERR